MQAFVQRGLASLLLLSLALAGCDRPASETPVASTGLQVWLDQPIDGSALPPGPFTLRGHARDAGGSGVETITFLVSSAGTPAVTVGSVSTDPALALAVAEFDWNPSVAGEYLVQAQAFNRAGYVFSAVARICIGSYTPDGVCAAGPLAGFQLQGLVMSDLDGDGSAAGPGEGPLPGVTVSLSGCGSQTVLTNPPSGDLTLPAGGFAFAVTTISGCVIEAGLRGWTFASMEGNPAAPIPWPADEAAHVILLRPSGEDNAPTSTPTASATVAAQGPSATPSATQPAEPTKTLQPGQASPTFTKTAVASATPEPSDTPEPTKTLQPGQASPTFTKTAVASATPEPSDTPEPTKTVAPSATSTKPGPPSDTPKPPADTTAPTIDQVSALPNPTFYGGECTKEQAQFTASAGVSDPAGVTGATLYYRYISGGTVGAWLTAAMAPAGGSLYTVSVTNNAVEVYNLLGGAEGIVEYYVQAQDGLGNAGQSASDTLTLQYCIS